MWAFFGLQLEDRLRIHEEIFDLSYYSNGAFTQEIAYNLPIYLRYFYLRKLIQAKQKENDQQKKESDNANRVVKKK